MENRGKYRIEYRTRSCKKSRKKKKKKKKLNISRSLRSASSGGNAPRDRIYNKDICELSQDETESEDE